MRADRKTFHLIYTLNFLLTLAWALPMYAQSSYLKKYAGASAVALYPALATALTLGVILFYPRVIQRFSNYRIMMSVLALDVVNLMMLSWVSHPLTILVFFSSYMVTGTLLGINVDVFLEDISDNQHTGKIRTTLLTIANLAWVSAPLLMGRLASGERYQLVWLSASLILVPALLLLLVAAHAMGDHFRYRSRHFHQLVAVILKNPNIAKIFSIALSLRFFYFIMILYVPLHLHENLGFAWTTIGWILTVMLLPFVILQLPAGRIADRYLGEKEILVAGLITMMVFTGLIFFTRSTSPVVWAAILFMTRVGAALVEAMQEVYFFKLIDRRDVDLINLFRDLGPTGWLAASLFSFVALAFLTLPALFLLLAVVLMVALKPALTLQDTR